MFIIKVTVKENSFASNLQRDELLQRWKLREFIYSKSYHIVSTVNKQLAADDTLIFIAIC